MTIDEEMRHLAAKALKAGPKKETNKNKGIGVVGLGVVAGIVFGGNVAFFNDVLDGLLGVVTVLGENGLVGLLVAAILIGLLNK